MTSFDVDAFLGEREPHRGVARIVVKNHLVDQIAELERVYRDAKKIDEKENRIPEAPGIAEQLATARTELEASARLFIFEEIPGHLWDTLVREHPPTKQHRDAAKEEGATVSWNPDTFPPALFAAASVDPKLDREGAKKLWRGLPHGERFKLWTAAFGCQQKVGRVPLPVSGTGTTPTTATSSDTAPPEASPEASS